MTRLPAPLRTARRRVAAGAGTCLLACVTLGGLVLTARPASAIASASGVDAGGGAGLFADCDVALRQQAALLASAGEDPLRWPPAAVRAVATGWNAAASEASRLRVGAPLLREQWNLLVNDAAETWANLAIGATTGAPGESLAAVAYRASALGDDLAAILPVMRAVSGGDRAALLLTTSVGCECTMLRVGSMEDVWMALAGWRPGAPGLAAGMERQETIGGTDRSIRLGRSDLASSPTLPDAFGLDRVPGWPLLEPGGEVAFRVDGGEGVAEITTMIRRWLGGEDLRR